MLENPAMFQGIRAGIFFLFNENGSTMLKLFGIPMTAVTRMKIMGVANPFIYENVGVIKHRGKTS